MDLNFWLPPGVVAWIASNGGFLIVSLLCLLLGALAFRPVVLWYFRIPEHRLYQKKQVELDTRIAVELEAMNQLLRRPLKKSAPEEKSPTIPVSEKEKDAFLEALKKLRPKGTASPDNAET